MPRLFLEYIQSDKGVVWIEGDNARYLTSVLRCGVGDAVVLFDAAGRHFNATLMKAGRNDVILSLGEELPGAPKPVRDVVLAQGILKGKKMDYVIQKAVELGVSGVVPLQSDRAVVRQTRKHELWQKIALEATRQCGRTAVPRVERPIAFTEYFSPDMGKREGIIFWEEGQATMKDAALRPADKPLIVAVGPEGGFTHAEIDIATSVGLEVRSLGERILRADTAVVSALTIVQYLLGEMG